MPSSSRLYIAPEGQEAMQAGLMQWLQIRGRYMWKVFSNCLYISFCMLAKFLSRARDSNAPARSSSQLGPQVFLSIFSPVICGTGRAVGAASDSGEFCRRA